MRGTDLLPGGVTDPCDPLDLWERPDLAIVGVAKNCGKTTTLNTLLAARAAAPPGLLSTGVDGESEDVLLGTRKPSIVVRPGQWLVTTEVALGQGTAGLELVEPLGWTTAFGDALICRVMDEGTVVLSGIRHRRDLIEASTRLRALGAPGVWIDGAYGRIASAHPDVAPAFVVATGAAAGDTIDAAVARTAHLVEPLTLSVLDDPAHSVLLEEATRRRQALCLCRDDPTPRELASASALVALRQAAPPEGLTALAIPGLFSDSVAESLLCLELSTPPTILVPDGSAFHVTESLWTRLGERFELRTHQTMELAGISYNPRCVGGRSLDGAGLRRALQERWPGVPVFNSLGPVNSLHLVVTSAYTDPGDAP